MWLKSFGLVVVIVMLINYYCYTYAILKFGISTTQTDSIRLHEIEQSIVYSNQHLGLSYVVLIVEKK